MKYQSGYKYQTVARTIFSTRLRPSQTVHAYFITLYPNGAMIIDRGYAWDGASGPTWDTKNSMTPSLYHDAAAQLMRLGLLDQNWRIPSNEEFGDMLKARGMSWLRRKIWVRELNKFGGPSTDPKNRRPILEAP